MTAARAMRADLVRGAAPLEVSRVESATGWSEFVRRAADARLTGLVEGLCGYRERSRDPLRRHMPAGSRLPLILSFGERIEILAAADGAVRVHGSFVAGLHPGPASTRFAGGQFGVQVDLTPLGAYRILGAAGSALADRVVDLDDIAPELARLSTRLAEVDSWPGRFALVEHLLLQLVARGRAPDPLVSWMWQRLLVSGGRVGIADLVQRSGWSHRHVSSRFRSEIGLGPKAAAALIRFERAADLVTGGVPPAEVAACCGYADQSHLSREFVRLAGAPPAAFARSAVADVAVTRSATTTRSRRSGSSPTRSGSPRRRSARAAPATPKATSGPSAPTDLPWTDHEEREHR